MSATAIQIAEFPDRILKISASFPRLPSSLRYYDDFVGKYKSIRNLADLNQWSLDIDGNVELVDFSRFDEHLIIPIKHVCLDFVERYKVATLALQIRCIASFCEAYRDLAVIEKMLIYTPAEFNREWVTKISPVLSPNEASAFKSILHAFCRLGMGMWTDRYHAFVKGLPERARDLYRVVRTGECFIPLQQQSLIISYFDDLAAMVSQSPAKIERTKIRDACILIISYQYAFRPAQIARIRLSDVRTFDSGAVHISVRLLKQKSSQKCTQVSRRIKHEWCPIFLEYIKRRQHSTISNYAEHKANGELLIPIDSFFRMPTKDVGLNITHLTESITGKAWSANDLRHTAAQRQVDAGVSHVQLAEFMGHTSMLSSGVYFDSSPTQAQRVNQALALSPVFSTVAEVANTRFIDLNALLTVPQDQQIGAVPHGVPIAGIGLCGVGQSLCTKNPVLSCYTCRRFMPLRDTDIHQQVLDGFRPVVSQFEVASRGNDASPAYTQLRRTLTAVEQVIREIESAEGEQHE